MATRKSVFGVRETSAMGGDMKADKSRMLQKGAADMAAKIDQTDDLKLKMMTALKEEGLELQSDDLLYPAELNAHLTEQLRVMSTENSHLRKIIFEKGKLIKEHESTVEDLKQRIRDIISGAGPAISSKSAGIISAKITELCKQNRHLIAELECYKSKNGVLERKLLQLEMLNKEHDNLDACLCKEDAALDTLVTAEQMKELNMKLASVNKRLNESKRKNVELKNEIIAATKILQNELGNKFTSLKELQNGVAGWRGRAERIVILEAKVKELENMLNVNDKKDKDQHAKGDIEAVIKDLESKRRREVQNALKECNVVKEENIALKKRIECLKSRVRNLECDHTTLRQKMLTYTDKSNADDALINEQRNQIKALETYYQEMLKDNTFKMVKMQQDIDECHKKSANTVTKIECLRKQAAEKAKKIEELRTQLERYEECSLQSVFFTPMRTATDNEIQKLSMMVCTLNERLDNERQNWDELNTAHCKLKEKKKHLERRVFALEEELRQIHESRRGSRASRSSIPKSEHREFPIPKKPKFSLAADPDGTLKQSTSTESSSLEPIEGLDKEEMRFKVILLEEKVKALKEKMKMVVEEKNEDFVNLTEMIQTSKQLFNEALVVLQKERCLCI